MKGMKYTLALCCLVMEAGCATISWLASDDPAVKLRSAAEDFGQKNEPVAAEKLIREAIDSYGRKSDQLGLAEAYRQYGLFYRSNAVSTAADYYEEYGFLDKTVAFKDRYEKAIEHFNLSRYLYEDLGRYDDLSTRYISLAKTYDMTNRLDEACNAFYKSLESFALFKLNNPETDESRSDEIASYREYVESMRKQAGCPDTPVQPAKPSPPAPTSPYAPSEPPAQPEQAARGLNNRHSRPPE